MSLAQINNPPARRSSQVVLLLLMIVFLTITLLSSPGVAVTLDEPLHYHYGLFILEGKADRIDDSSMPVYALNALPFFLASRMPEVRLRTVLEGYFVARLVTILFAAAFAAVVYHWARSLYGAVPAFFSTFLYILDPNIIANSQLVTADVTAAGMMMLSMYLAWRFANKRTVVNGILCAVAVALSQLVKYTALALFPLCLGGLLIYDLVRRGSDEPLFSWPRTGRALRRLAVYAVAGIATSLLVINVGFRWDRSLTRFGGYRFQSALFRGLQAGGTGVASIPVPVPYPFLDGLDWMRNTERTADRYGNVYLLGHLSKPAGFPGYYFVAGALKTPIATQILIVAALATCFLDPERRARLLQNELFLVLPVLVFTVYLNFLFNTQTGIRYGLITFPLLCILGGALFANWRRAPNWFRAAGILMLLWLGASVLAYFPYFTPYFNELVWDKTQTYKYLSDSNLEWGQSQGALRRYLEGHPGAIYNPSQPQSGLIVVGGSDLVGILEKPSRYQWLRENFEPDDTIAYSYFVYDISPGEISDLCSHSAYCQPAPD